MKRPSRPLLRMAILMLASTIALLSGQPSAHAWNYFGHRVIASIAFRQLDDATRDRVVRILKAHPAYREL